jgi:RHH-type proline utilization regulon transcriptional repressor/proline dehydrogenase/delta 1-pyrroline-5-carboxylate dehydrogenase
VGLEILREAAVTPGVRTGIKRTILELGGKNALIVDDTADLDAAIPDITHSAFGYSGQKCSACSRLIVIESILDSLLGRLREATSSLIVAPAEDPATQIGPLIEEAAVERLRGAIETGLREGELLHLGDIGELAERGFFVPPAIVGGVPPSHALAQDELFGPLITVLPVRDFDEAIAVANDTSYALTGGLHSRTPAHLERARCELQVGNLYLNRGITGAIVGRQPFGGHRFSGIGSKAGGPDYLKQFLVAHTICENTMRHGFAPLEEAG